MQIKPSPELSHIVKHYLLLESDFESLKQLRLFSDGNTGMVICLQNLLFQKSGNEIETLPRIFVYGQLSKFNDIFSIGKISLIIVVFHPYGAYAFLQIPANILKDQIIPLSDLYGTEASFFEESVVEASVKTTHIPIIERFIARIVRCEKKQSAAISALTQLTLHKNGIISVKELAGYGCMSERQLERKFIEFIGHTPKQFTNIIRLQYFLKLLKTKTVHSNLTSIVFDAGYYDQAHLIKEFKKKTGLTPTQYQSQTQSLALNFFRFRDVP